jgi:hypothetical protein
MVVVTNGHINILRHDVFTAAVYLLRDISET